MISNIPIYASVLLRAHLGDDEGQVILAKDTREDQASLWVHITPEGDFNTYPLEAFSSIDDFKGFVRYGPTH